MMKDLVTPVPVEEINSVVKSCLEKAALINYTKLSEAAKIEGRLRLQDIIVDVAATTTTVDGADDGCGCIKGRERKTIDIAPF